jgi:hypothetical protein
MQSLTTYGRSPASTRFFVFCAQVLQPVQRRHESSYRRTRSKLNIKPDPAFLPSKTEQHDHIIYNPPPSMPNVYHTPTIFLPRHDKRKAIQATLASLGVQPPQTEAQKLLPVFKETGPIVQLTQADVDEIRRLRMEDPYKWSQTQLTKKFNTSNAFVGYIIRGMSPEKAEQQKVVEETIRSNWGKRRRTAREDRQIRKDRWFRDE